MNAEPEPRGHRVADREDELEFARRILARLIELDDTSRFPDVHEIREMAREILTEQLREARERAAGAPAGGASPHRRPRTG